MLREEAKEWIVGKEGDTSLTSLAFLLVSALLLRPLTARIPEPALGCCGLPF